MTLTNIVRDGAGVSERGRPVYCRTCRIFGRKRRRRATITADRLRDGTVWPVAVCDVCWGRVAEREAT